MGVEPLPGDILRDLPRERRRTPSPGRASDPHLLKLEKPVQVRLRLQQRAPRNLRRHVTRDAGRVVVLILGDLAAFALMRGLLRAVRDGVVLGGTIAGYVRDVLPAGLFNGWQFAAALLVALVVTGNYGAGDQRRDMRRLFLGAALATALPLWMTIWARGIEVVAVQYLLATVLVWAGVVMERLMVDRVVALVVRPSRRRVRTILVGPADECRDLGRGPAFAEGTEHVVLGFVDAHVPPAPDAIGHIGEFSQFVHETRAETVIVCGHLTDEQFHNVVDAALAAGCELLSAPRAMEVAGVHPALVWRRGQLLVELTAPNLKAGQLAIKRMADVVGSVVGLIVAGPLMALIAIAIRRDSAGPVFFAQDRVGLGGRGFRMLKFRTMTDGADARKGELAHLNHTGDSRLFKIPNDPRVTGLGAFLRRWSLDELPQLWNVLVGDMSLIGPRPFFEEDLAGYQDHHLYRLGAKPGITGLWQVSGRSEILTFEEVVAFDNRYIREWSLLLDLEILFRTIPAVLRRKGAV